MTTKLRELLTRGAESELIQSTLYDRIIESVKANLIGTQIIALRLGPTDIKGSSIDIPLNTTNNMAVDEIAEGAEFNKQRAAAYSFNMKPKKYGLDCQITKEMVEDGNFAMVEWNVTEAGYQMARKLDNLIMSAIETGAAVSASTTSDAGAGTVAGGSAITVANDLRVGNYNPDYLIVSAAVEDDLRNIDTFHEADKLGSREVFERGVIGRIMGMTVLVSNQVTANYAYVVDSKYALALAEKRPITIESYKQENMDLVGLAVSARWAVRHLRAGACCLITTS
jgi:N4-gp56 family major capsid protein